MSSVIVCKNCGVETVSRYSTTKFCSDACRAKFNKKNKGRKQTCKYCGNEFRNYKIRDCCSIHCKNEYKKELTIRKKKDHKVEKVCFCCKKSFITTKNNKIYCSKNCSYEHQKEVLRQKKDLKKSQHQKKCKECGKHFVSNRMRATFCSKVCSNKYENRRRELIRRKRIMANGRVDWSISIERLLKRDGSICYLCHKSFDLYTDTNDDYYPSIEHVIPISKGGTHTWDNVKLAHRKCNTLKRDKILKRGS
ncbi:HNH endonuclease [Niallia sp.]|uniref:HNH endonuclease n=1 Tax=Niallia sp. TaxID=2837523 RepID=UPI00289D4CB2|nr:HNH endonuclease [Niallia sp.]